MRTQALSLLAAIAFAVPALAQTEGQDQKDKPSNTEKLWKIECSGIGGWGAASQAARISSILEKERYIKHLVFDTTGIGYFEVSGDKVPEIAELNDTLIKKRAGKVRVKTLEEVEVEKAEAVYEVSVAGLGWMNTAIQTRDVLSKVDGVIRVHPNGLNGKALVFVREKDDVDIEVFKKAFEGNKKLSVRKMKRTRV